MRRKYEENEENKTTKKACKKKRARVYVCTCTLPEGARRFRSSVASAFALTWRSSGAGLYPVRTTPPPPRLPPPRPLCGAEEEAVVVAVLARVCFRSDAGV